MAEAKTVPPLPAGNIDFNKLNTAAHKDNLDKFLDVETEEGELPSAVEIQEAEQEDTAPAKTSK